MSTTPTLPCSDRRPTPAIASPAGALLATLAALMSAAVMSVAAPAAAQTSTTAPPGRPAPKVAVSLVAPVAAIRPGAPFTVGLRQIITPHWHTYWVNPGDSGEATRLTWTLPDGVTAGAIGWPIPTALPVGPLMNYGYEGEVLLPVTVTPAATLAPGTVATLEAKAEWLVCEKVCVPEEAVVRLSLPVVAPGAPVAASAEADLFAAAARRLPVATDWAARLTPTTDGALRLDVAAPGLDATRIAEVRLFPTTWGHVEAAAPQPVAWTADGLSIGLKPGEVALAPGATFEAVLVLAERLAGGETARNGLALRATVAAGPPAAPVLGGGGAAGGGTGSGGAGGDLAGLGATGSPIGLWQALAFALLGGLILNVMPCVLPILSIKIVHLAGHGGDAHGRAAAVRGGLGFLAGVLASFAALTVLMVALRGTGEAFGWGFQFQSPTFVLGLAALFLALGLSMSGVFDVGGALVSASGRSPLAAIGARGGPVGAFATGVLATVAATPCTAPFMGAAMGFAMARPAGEMLAVMLALGLGFALPVVGLSLSERARARLPRPGPWMVTLKQVLAFPLYATAAWLVWVLSLQAGSDGVLAAAIVLTAVGFACWLVGLGGLDALLRGAAATAATVLALALALPLLDAPAPAATAAPVTGGTAVGTGAVSTDASEPFSMARVAELRAGGRAVFVNLTAAWCVTCKVNEQVALASAGFRQALIDHDVAYLKGDWTRRDDHITRVLEAFGRAGVPLYVLFPPNPKAAPIVLPQLLTETTVTSAFAAVRRGAADGRSAL